MKNKLTLGCLSLALMSLSVLGFAEQQVARRIREVPAGWSDDIDAVMAEAKAEKKNVFVFFPLQYDQVGMNGTMYSSTKACTSAAITKALSKDFVLAFNSWQDMLNRTWKKLDDFTRFTPAYLIVTADGEFVWKGNPFSAFDLEEGMDARGWSAADFEDKLGLGFARTTLPQLEAALPKVTEARRRAEKVSEGQEKAKLLYQAFKDLDPKFAQRCFGDDVEMMVKADKGGNLGIRERYPYYWIVLPLVKVRLNLWNEREGRIRNLRSKDNKLSRKEAARIATMSMKDEWKPKFEKLLKVAKRAEGKLEGNDLGQVKALEDEVEKHLEFWDLKTTELPFF